MITGCPDCPHQGDGNSQAGLQAHINRVPGPTVTAPGPSTADVEGIVRSLMAMSALTGQDARAVVDAALALAADRPSVTDNARAETTTEHEHDWRRQQNVTSKGYRLPPIEVCRAEGCDAARPAETTTAEDYVRATARAVGLDPDEAAAYLPAETTTEWGVRSTDTGAPYQRHDEEDARHVAARQGWAVVRREVTPWTEADR